MVIGIKYCGGCNPTYHRISAADWIKKRLSTGTFLPYECGKQFDAVLVICGCGVACAGVCKDTCEKIYLRDQNEINIVLEKLKAINGEIKKQYEGLNNGLA